MVFLVHSRMGPDVYVGPFTSAEHAFAWSYDRTPGITWGVITLQDPEDPATPDWR